jgi:peptidase E
MAIYYLCSGFGMEHSFCNDFGKRLSEDVKKRNSIVYIPASNNTGEILDQVSFFKAQLIEIDMVFPNHIILNSDSMSCDDMKKAINKADLVYLVGGYPWDELDLIQKSNLTASLKQYDGVMLGISAGAMIMSKYIIMVTDGPNSDKSVIKKGLNIVNYSIYPHCNFSGEDFKMNFYVGSDLVISQKLIDISRGKGDVFCLQNKDENNTIKISLIRTVNGKSEIISINNGTVWKIMDNFVKITSIE